MLRARTSPGAERTARAARTALGIVRIVNGALGLLAPQVLVRRLSDQTGGQTAAAVYGLRLFGVRTVLIGADLLRLRGAELDRAVARGVLIHASDTATAAALLRAGRVPPPIVAISALNTALAVTAYVAGRRR